MAKNVEIKARIHDYDALRERAEHLADGPVQIIEQEDAFFNAQHGRLKLRQLTPHHGQLIFYDRPDVSGPITSTYSVTETNNPAALRGILSSALGETAHVKKVRELYIVAQTRIHLDTVEGLGQFIELEVMLADHETEIFGQNIACTLMKQLNIAESDLIKEAYADLLQANATNRRQ